ncbi:MAG: DUF2971 domain-containing protein [Candidatus Thiodiazotropha lotti]
MTSKYKGNEINLDQLARHLDSKPYSEKRILAYKHIRSRLPRFLYKYRSIDPNNEDSLRRIQDIIVGCNVYLSSPADFNDPFDMSANIILKGGIRNKIKRLRLLAKSQAIRYKDRAELVKTYMSKTNDELLKILEKTYIEHITDIGVCSFAGTPKSILMWSHYAFNHTGICIQFERIRDLKSLGQALKVEYSGDYPEIDWINKHIETLTTTVLRKHSDWSYEKEERIILPNAAGKLLRLNAKAITGVILGCKAPRNVIETIQSLIAESEQTNKNNIKLYKAVKHKSRYALSILKY